MSWLQIAQKGQMAYQARNSHRLKLLKRKDDLVREFGKWGFLISVIENYSEDLNPQIKLPIEVIIMILKMLVDDDDPKRELYHYLPTEGKMNRSPFRFNMTRFAPYQNKYLKPAAPMHDLSRHRYKLTISDSYICLQTTSDDQKISRDFKVALDLKWNPLDNKSLEIKKFSHFLKGISCFEQFKAKLFKTWKITDQSLLAWSYDSLLPDVLDPRNDFYKMRQFWGVIYTIRGMIDFPL